MRGGADPTILERFTGTTERAAAGELDDWASTPRGRLALILALDQFPRSVWRESARAYAQDPKALGLVLEGLENGHYEALPAVWEKAFFLMPLIHCEGEAHLDRANRCVELNGKLLDEAPAHLRQMYEFNAQQPVLHRDVIAAFGRHPHRNQVLGRASTPEEIAYLEKGEFPHRRMPPETKG
jgi:uncharacterized protein (DUF924 family)